MNALLYAIIINRGYYTVARKYEFYVPVARAISRSLPSLVKYCFCHEEHKTSYLRQTDDGVFDDFPKISNHFRKIFEDSPKLVRMSHECCRTFSENFRK